MKSIALFGILMVCALFACTNNVNKEGQKKEKTTMTAKEILGNPKYLAMSYGGYRENSRDIQPSVSELKEDMRILHAIGVRVIRTYQTKLAHPHTLLKAIKELRSEDSSFEMYVMLGVWIDCENAWTAHPNHFAEDTIANQAEIERAVEMANAYPDIVKIVAVGNEAMVKWAATYHVQPNIILKWVNRLQDLKSKGKLGKDIWITSSDNFASWGGGETSYHVDDLNKLIKAVDYISLHTYPMHDTHYNPNFWGNNAEEEGLSKNEKILLAMKRAVKYAQNQYDNTVAYMKSIGIDKPVHIGETGWASSSNGLYGGNGSKATDEYKEGIYYKLIREWTNKNKISCFYFEAFDENWKDARNPGGSENHFGLFTIEGKAKYGVWEYVDNGSLNGLKRDGNEIRKSFNGNINDLMESVENPPIKNLEFAY